MDDNEGHPPKRLVAVPRHPVTGTTNREMPSVNAIAPIVGAVSEGDDPSLRDRPARVRLEPYNDSWPEAFAAEAASLKHCLSTVSVELEHVGSTSVPRMTAKPIIDILVGVADPWAPGIEEALVDGAGYRYTPESEADDPGRRVFRKGPTDWQEIRTHHVHVTQLGGPYWQRILAFRDWMRTHPHDAAEYVELKLSLAAAYPTSPRQYSRSKADFVRRIEHVALPRATVRSR